MAGANPAAVQRILRHSDPKITMDTYAHLEPGYLRREINLLRFESDTDDSGVTSFDKLRMSGGGGGRVTRVLPQRSQPERPDRKDPKQPVRRARTKRAREDSNL